MNRTIKLKRRNKGQVNAYFKRLDISYLDEIMNLQSKIYDLLDKKNFYFNTSRHEFINILNNIGTVIGCISCENDELIAIGVCAAYKLNEENYGYDFEFEEEDLLKTVNFESTIVLPEYRGNNLQRKIIGILEECAAEENMKYIGATADPDNIYSVNNIKSMGFEIIKEKEKYGGLRRYIFKKEI